jgi:outer membrane protein assembly factor BamC
MTLRLLKVSISLFACVVLAACASDWRKIDYKSTRTLPPLEVPPDLASPPENSPAPAAAPARATLSEHIAEQKPAAVSPPAAAAKPQSPTVRVERDRQLRWLVVQATPDSLWPSLRQFVTTIIGLAIDRENVTSGMLETEWVESRLPGASAQAKRLGWYYPALTRYKIRFRLERGGQPGTTEIYVSAFGLEPVAANAAAGVSAGWRPSVADADIEAEVQTMLAAYLGAPEGAVRAAAAQKPALADRASLLRRGDSIALRLEDSLDRAWRRVGLSIDRIGFTVEDRDRSKGIYYVRYLDPDKSDDRPGWLARLFGAEDKKLDDRFQILLQGAESGTTVMVRNSAGVPEIGKTGERILSLLLDQLK